MPGAEGVSLSNRASTTGSMGPTHFRGRWLGAMRPAVRTAHPTPHGIGDVRPRPGVSRGVPRSAWSRPRGLLLAGHDARAAIHAMKPTRITPSTLAPAVFVPKG